MNESQTADLVRIELETDLFIMDYLKEDIVNVAALARKMLPKIKKENRKANIESVSIAIKRHVQNSKKEKMNPRLKKVISNSQINIRDNIIHVTMDRTLGSMNKVNEISKKIRWDQDEFCLINQGAGEITIIADEKNIKLFNGEIKKKLALLTIKESITETKGIDTPGLYSYFISQLSKRAVNIIEIVSTSSQVSFLIDEKDLTKAYDILKKCVEFCK